MTGTSRNGWGDGDQAGAVRGGETGTGEGAAPAAVRMDPRFILVSLVTLHAD